MKKKSPRGGLEFVGEEKGRPVNAAEALHW